MKKFTIPAAIVASTLAFSSLSATSETVRDCVLDGTVKKHNADDNKVYVAFHSAKPAEQGANCRLRKKEKLQFKAPSDSQIQDAKPGAKVQYRYTEDSEEGASWELRKVSAKST